MKRPGRLLLVGSAVAAIVSTACLTEAWHITRKPLRLNRATLSRASPIALPVPITSPTDPQATVGEYPPLEQPVRLVVPEVGLSAAVVPVGLSHDGSIALPIPSLAGWYRWGPVPGAVGPAVLVGHVDSRSGPAIFYRLSELRVGDTLTVTRADGSGTEFAINEITVVRKPNFPTNAIFAPTDQPELRLVTCIGEFDPRRHHYLDSLIVWATAALDPPSRRGPS